MINPLFGWLCPLPAPNFFYRGEPPAFAGVFQELAGEPPALRRPKAAPTNRRKSVPVSDPIKTMEKKSRKKTEDFPERRVTARLTELSHINDSSSATRPTRAFDCNRDAMAGFAAAYG